MSNISSCLRTYFFYSNAFERETELIKRVPRVFPGKLINMKFKNLDSPRSVNAQSRVRRATRRPSRVTFDSSRKNCLVVGMARTLIASLTIDLKQTALSR